MKKIELIPIWKDDEFIGYEAENLNAYMKSIGKLKAWEEWYRGQTGMIIDGKFIVYHYDVDRFRKGLPDADLL